MKTPWLFLFALLIPYLTSCAQVEVSLSGDNAHIVEMPPYSFNPEDVPDATPRCPFTIPVEYTKQNNGVWCWAASAQMVINYLQLVSGETDLLSQCQIASNALAPAVGDPPDCCMAEETCRVRFSPQIALRKNNYSAIQAEPPINWTGLDTQLCGKHTPYISVVQFYDDDGTLAGAHSSVVQGARETADGERYVEVSDHLEDGFFLMKWSAFEGGVPGDFEHKHDYIDIHKLPVP